MRTKLWPEQYLGLDKIDNPDIKRKAEILVQLIISTFFFLLITFVLTGLASETFRPRHFVVISILFISSLFFLNMVRNGHIRLSAMLFISFWMLLIFVTSWFGGGLKAHGIKILPVVVLFSGLTLGKKEIWYFGFAAALGGLVFLLADYIGFMPKSEIVGSSNLVYWLYSSTGVLAMCFLANMSVGMLQTSLNQSEKDLQLRIESEELLKTNNIQLADIMRFESHVVRKSLANVLGIFQHIDFNDLNNPANKELMEHLSDAANQLDGTLHEMMEQSDKVYSMPKNNSLKNEQNLS
jgi:hypothetical protein